MNQGKGLLLINHSADQTSAFPTVPSAVGSSSQGGLMLDHQLMRLYRLIAALQIQDSHFTRKNASARLSYGPAISAHSATAISPVPPA